MNLWKDILDSKFENQTRPQMEKAAADLGYRFFNFKGRIFEIKKALEGGTLSEDTGRTAEQCAAPEVWAVLSEDERQLACIPRTQHPLLFADLPHALAFVQQHGGKVAPWLAAFHRCRELAGVEQSRIILPG